ncbi:MULTISPECIES: coniferyl aldehyde dehydrogenase [Henriciella]|jgi:coniferyl-aldehyde dehydrogenase|uniref:coniferyl aldehyde dehydrogenase n=1 Tax=Henriciella TaxID=453849 RepID=UPI00351427C2
MPLEGGPAGHMNSVLAAQKAAHIRDGIPSAEKRYDWLERSIDLLVTHGDSLGRAMSEDFGHRSRDQSDFTDIASSIAALKYAKKHLKSWMKPEKRSVDFPLNMFGAKARLHFQPKGTVGVISPWNFPVNLTFTPLAGIFAAGNRAMIKPSEFTEATSELMKKLISEYYSEEEVAVVTGGPDVGAAFSSLPFDHLVFTGATSIAHHVMRAAADNLVPLTLELGGKSPVILGNSADLDKAAKRIMAGKTLNAGQICLAPDYAFVPKDKTREFIAAATGAVETMFPSGLKENDDYTSVVNQRHFERLNGYLDDARAKGAEIIEINPRDENFTQQPHHKMAPHIIVDPTDDMKVMQDEIFGPILPIKSYSDTKDAVNYVNAHPRPLGLYYFGQDASERDYVLNNTTSGGVTVNDVIFHVAQEDLPFGGVGPSGMGSYHGIDGFREFSHRKSVYTQIGADLLAVIRPPYGEKFRKQVESRLKR